VHIAYPGFLDPVAVISKHPIVGWGLPVMLKFVLGFVILFSLTGSNAFAKEDVLYCTSEHATGLSKEKTGWITAKFEHQRFTIKHNINFTKAEGGLDSVEYFTCSRRYKNAVSCIMALIQPCFIIV
jgi:hypothetical protein